MYMRNVCLKALFLASALAALVGGAFRLEAQTSQTLMQFTNNWFYDDTGRELGTGWRAANYVPDANWHQGPGLIGYEPDSPNPYRFHAPVSTVLFISNPIFPTNYYYRGSFNFSGSTVGLSLYITNLIDDGAVIYLNGTEVGRFRIPAGQNAATFASGGPGTEGTLETITVTNISLLRQGQNVIAAEVHQGDIASSDTVWGCKVVTVRSDPLVITTNLPAQVIAYLAETLTLDIGLTGGPAFYRWFRDGTQVSTNRTFRASPVAATTAGNYWVVVTNNISAVTSAVCRVVVFPDSKGPEVSEVVGKTNSATSLFKGAPTIDIAFNEPLFVNAVLTNSRNFFVYAGTNFASPVLVTNVTYTFTDRPRIHLWVSGPNWMVGSNYFVMIKGNVADSRGTNNIDPYTLIGVSWEVKTNIMQMSDSWSFYSGSAFLDPSYPDVYDDFMNPGYVINYNAGWGGPASGILYFVQVDPSLIVCAGDRANGAIGFQNSPACFVRTVVIPTNYLASAQNAILTTNRFIADDGMILYINGQEVYRWNIAGTLPLNESTLAAANQGIPPCQTVVLTLTNVLRPGTNYIAAAVVQSAAAEGDVVFGLEVDATFLRTSPTPPPASGILFSNRWDFNRTTTNLVLNWPTNFYGSKLEYTTNLGADAIWLQVKDQNDPYTNNVSGATAGPRRFYRLVR